jgi:hypothetical protein
MGAEYTGHLILVPGIDTNKSQLQIYFYKKEGEVFLLHTMEA